MQPQLQGIEVEAPGRGNDDLTIDDDILWQRLQRCRMQLGEVAIERTTVAALDVHVIGAAEDDGAKSVPFGLVEVIARRYLIGEPGEHGRDRRLQRKTRQARRRRGRIRSIAWSIARSHGDRE